MSTDYQTFPVVLDIDDGNAGEGCPSRWVPEDGETVVSIHNDSREQGYPADDSDPLSWLNSARVYLDPDDDAVTFSISTGDPRGAFVLVVRRIPDDAPNNAGQLVMAVPHPGDSLLHAPLVELRPGTYIVAGEA